MKVLVLVPLEEELTILSESLKIVECKQSGLEFLYTLESPSPNVALIAVLLGEAGLVTAAQRAERILSIVNPDLVVVLGIAGALSSDVALGDVVIADELDYYLSNSKAIDGATGFVFKTSGRHARTHHSFLQVIRNFKFAAKDLYGAWSNASKGNIHVGRVACGDTVSDSKNFVEFLLASDRKYLAIEMESSGVAEATQAREVPVPLVIVRGISDRSSDKVTLDHESKGAFRRLAVQNAGRLLKLLISWSPFASVSPGIKISNHGSHLEEVRDFVDRNK